MEGGYYSVINDNFIKFYYTKLGKFNEKMRGKYGGLSKILIIHWDETYGPTFAGSLFFRRDNNEYKISGVDFPKLIGSFIDDPIKFCESITNQEDNNWIKVNQFLTGSTDILFEIKNEDIVVLLYNIKDCLYYEPINFNVNVDLKGRGGPLQFSLLLVYKTRPDTGKIKSLIDDYTKMLKKYFEKLKMVDKKIVLKDMGPIYSDIIKQFPREVYAGATIIDKKTHEKIVKQIDEYFDNYFIPD